MLGCRCCSSRLSFLFPRSLFSGRWPFCVLLLSARVWWWWCVARTFPGGVLSIYNQAMTSKTPAALVEASVVTKLAISCASGEKRSSNYRNIRLKVPKKQQDISVPFFVECWVLSRKSQMPFDINFIMQYPRKETENRCLFPSLPHRITLSPQTVLHGESETHKTMNHEPHDDTAKYASTHGSMYAWNYTPTLALVGTWPPDSEFESVEFESGRSDRRH